MDDLPDALKPRKVLPPVYFFASLLLMLGLHYVLPGPRILSGSVRYLGIVLMGAALGFGLWARMLFVQVGTTVKPFQESSELVVQGPFQITRNPMYLSMAVFLLGLAVLLGSLIPFFVIPVFVLIINRRFIPAEESMLERRFGEPYRNYQGRVRRWI
jgi:protein-S-isoprenylcysteine O-methyltransferase Ste14